MRPANAEPSVEAGRPAARTIRNVTNGNVKSSRVRGWRVLPDRAVDRRGGTHAGAGRRRPGVLVGAAGLPAAAGEISFAGLSAPVTVYRDARGIPQIFARTAADLFAAQGTCTRRTGSGRWTSAATSRPDACRSCSGPTRWPPTPSCVRWAGAASPSRSGTCWPARPAHTSGVRDRGQRLDRRQRWRQGDRGQEPGVLGARTQQRRVHHRAVAARGLAGLAQGDGLGPARQHGFRDRARAAARARAHPGAGGPALSRVPVRPQPPHHPRRRGREGRLRRDG